MPFQFQEAGRKQEMCGCGNDAQSKTCESSCPKIMKRKRNEMDPRKDGGETKLRRSQQLSFRVATGRTISCHESQS